MQPRIYLTDGQRESELDINIRGILDQEGLLVPSATGKDRVISFCGFVVDASATVVSLPKTLELQNDDLGICRLLYKVFVRFFREGVPISDGSSSEDPNDREDKTNLSVFHLYDDLLDDWARYGIYRNRVEVERVGLSGRPNWKRTIKGVIPYHDHKGVPIYPHFHTERRDLRVEGLVSEIHRWCVANADHSIGWLKCSGYNTSLFPSIAYARDRAPCDTRSAVLVLSAELQKCYEQRKIRLLNLMIKLLQNTNVGRRIEQKQYGVRRFWPVWESMCKAYLADQSHEHGRALPQPSYRKSDGGRYNTMSNIGQRPDVVIGSQGDTLAVIDAKYYDVRQGVPGWKDIVKQLFYSLSYKTTGYATDVRNVLMFPKPIGTSLPDSVFMDVPEHVRCGNAFDKVYFQATFPPIECRYLSIIEAMNSYVCKVKGESLRDCLLRVGL